MAHIAIADAQAWAETTKLDITALDANVEDAQATIVLSKLAAAFDTSTWTDATNTPPLIKKIIAMRYVAYFVGKTYLEDEGVNPYATLLLTESDNLIAGIVSGTIIIPGLASGINQNLNQPIFYPTDLSSTQQARDSNMDPNDLSLGPPAFTVGRIF